MTMAELVRMVKKSDARLQPVPTRIVAELLPTAVELSMKAICGDLYGMVQAGAWLSQNMRGESKNT